MLTFSDCDKAEGLYLFSSTIESLKLDAVMTGNEDFETAVVFV